MAAAASSIEEYVHKLRQHPAFQEKETKTVNEELQKIFLSRQNIS